MYVLIIIAVVCTVALAWFWHHKPSLKGAPARTWPAGRGNVGTKRKFVVPFSK